jgi:hypothetical protein
VDTFDGRDGLALRENEAVWVTKKVTTISSPTTWPCAWHRGRLIFWVLERAPAVGALSGLPGEPRLPVAPVPRRDFF